MMQIGQNRPTAETHQYENKLSSFKVNELQLLLTSFKVQKIGKKNELYTRCVELLRTPSMTKQVIDKIREIDSRQNPRSQPYPLPTMNNHHNPYQQQQQQMYRQPAMNGYNNYLQNMGQQYGGLGMHNNSGSGMMSINPRPARNLTPMPLPFYDPIHTLVEPQELPPSINSSNKMSAHIECQFTLAADHHLRLSIRENEFPRVEVQLRFFNTTGDILNIEQADDFPLNCAVKLNDVQVALPNVIPTNKPNTEPKRPSRPVNITREVIGQPRDRRHLLKIDWTADKRQWAVAVYLVTRVNSDILKKRVLSSPSFELPYGTTEATIRKRLGGDDDDVAMDSLKISLLCPLMKTRMKYAARGRDCTHLQCFDLDSYLMLNEKKPAWKCGVCNANSPYSKLIIDKYFMKMLDDQPSSVTEVELLKDGTYRVLEEEFEDLSDDDADVRPVSGNGGGAKTSSTGGGTKAAAAPAAAASKKDDDVITLSDDEGTDDKELRAAIRASMPSSAGSSGMQRFPNKASSPQSSDDSIIILDDTPPRPDPASRMNGGPSSSTSSSVSSSNWRPVSASTAGSSSASPAVVTASSPSATAGGGAASSSSGGGAPQRVQTLSEVLGQAGHRPGGVPAQLQLNPGGCGPLSAAPVANQQPTFYNWHQHQQQPQSAPPMLNQQWGQYQQQMHAQQYAGYFSGMAYGNGGYGQQQQWVPPNAPAYGQMNGGGVIRRNDDLPRDPRDPR